MTPHFLFGRLLFGLTANIKRNRVPMFFISNIINENIVKKNGGKNGCLPLNRSFA